MRTLLLILLLAPIALKAQDAVRPQDQPPANEYTLRLLVAQRPAEVTSEQWRLIVGNPANATLFPIRLTQAMLDTIDARQLDRRYQYVMVDPIR